jgi:hypothetical protein
MVLVRPIHLRTVTPPLAVILLASVALAACGGSDDSATNEAAQPAPEASAFPSPDGRRIEELLAEYEPTNEIVVSPAGRVYTEGRNRYGFGVFEVDQTQITDAEVALYAAPASGGPAKGPFPARVESLETEPAFTAENTANDPDAAKAVYVSDVIFDRPGNWRVAALIKQSGGIVAANVPGSEVAKEDPVPGPGDEPPRIHTPTADEVGSLEEIDTRVPPSTMHEDDFADVLGKEPVVLLFATPALCQSRVCGPAVDVAEQVKRDRGDDAAFIHMEIYENNIPPDLREQVREFGLPTEPWLFVIDENGKIDTRIEGAFSTSELEQALDRVTGKQSSS